MEECIIGQWHKSVGDAVAVDELLCGVETDKTTMDVVSTESGVVRHLFYAAGDVVPVMRVIAIVGAADENIAALLAKHGGSGGDGDTGDGNVVEGDSAAVSGATTSTAADERAQGATAAADRSGATDRNTEQGHAGGARGDTATAAAPSIFTPRARSYLRKKRLTAEQFARHFPIDGLRRNVRSTVEEREVRAFFERLAPITPRALKTLIMEDKLLTIVSGSGIGGRILADDITALDSRPLAADGAARQITTDAAPIAGMERATERKRTPIAGMRKIIAQRMTHSLQSTAQVTLNSHADARGIRRARARYKQRGLPITINDMILYIVSQTLNDNPWANSLLVDGALIEYDEVHLGCAVQTEGRADGAGHRQRLAKEHRRCIGGDEAPLSAVQDGRRFAGRVAGRNIYRQQFRRVRRAVVYAGVECAADRYFGRRRHRHSRRGERRWRIQFSAVLEFVVDL